MSYSHSRKTLTGSAKHSDKCLFPRKFRFLQLLIIPIVARVKYKLFALTSFCSTPPCSYHPASVLELTGVLTGHLPCHPLSLQCSYPTSPHGCAFSLIISAFHQSSRHLDHLVPSRSLCTDYLLTRRQACFSSSMDTEQCLVSKWQVNTVADGLLS